jgi:hypothetical protein
MGGEVVLGRWCKHLSGARYVFVGLILHQMGGNGRDKKPGWTLQPGFFSNKAFFGSKAF